jgi:hypothetical protein
MCEAVELDQAEGVQPLLNTVRIDASSEGLWAAAGDIAAELGCLAPVIDEADAYNARGECRVNDFVATLRRHRTELFLVDPYKGASSYERAVYATREPSSVERKAGDSIEMQSQDALSDK